MSLNLTAAGLADQKAWEAAGYALPSYDREAMITRTKESPCWVHFGAGNIFRAFQANTAQELLNNGTFDRGVIVAEGFDTEIIRDMYQPHDNLSILVTLKADGSVEKTIVGSIAESLAADTADSPDFARLKEIFTKDSLQMATFTITEKGYSLKNGAGELLPSVAADFAAGPSSVTSYMGKVASLLYERFLAGEKPVAMVSTDNCSHNGEKLSLALTAYASAWEENKLVQPGFLSYLQNPEKVSFPWTMIDKITPRPHKIVEESLEKDGIEGMTPIVTSKNTFIAAFVNAERPQYLVVEDKFPNGRPALEKAGVYMTDRETVNKTERMKVTTCLNPLHTAMSVYGCMLGYDLICAEMKDEDIVALIKRLGYVEGLPVVVDPKILNPKAFIDEVIDYTLANAPYPEPVLAFCGAVALQAALAGRKVRDPQDNRTAIQNAAGVVTVNPATKVLVRTVPAYWRFDAQMGYQLTSKIRISANIQNLTDKTYYSQAYTSHYATIAPGRDRKSVV